MLSLSDFLYGLDKTKVIITDQDGKIVFPVRKEDLQYCENIINLGTPNEDGRYYYYNKIWYDIECFVIRGHDGLYEIQVFRDISKYIKNYIMLQIDAITNLPNRKLIMKLTAQLIEESIMCNTPFAIAMCDIDFFKSINDTYGHACGDFVLQTVSKIFIDNARQFNIRGNRALRGRDIVGRYGGEEFIFGFNNMGYEQAYNKIEKIRRIISQTEIEYNGQTIKCPTVSFGLRWVDNESFKNMTTLDLDNYMNSLINESDTALYQSKMEGRNRITVSH